MSVSSCDAYAVNSLHINDTCLQCTIACWMYVSNTFMVQNEAKYSILGSRCVHHHGSRFVRLFLRRHVALSSEISLLRHLRALFYVFLRIRSSVCFRVWFFKTISVPKKHTQSTDLVVLQNFRWHPENMTTEIFLCLCFKVPGVLDPEKCFSWGLAPVKVVSKAPSRSVF